MAFTADAKIQQVAEAYAEDAIELARDHFKRRLDWSDESARDVEAILADLHKQIPTANPTDEKVLQFAKAFGSYIGELFRKNHGAVWGVVTLGSDTFPGLRADRTGAEFWPWGKAYNRLKNGPEDNVWHYYCVLRSEDGKEPKLEQVDLSSRKPQKPWWRRILGGA